ncbi:hypothetical protein [Lacrimispora celerecrescens]|uniref:Uncharacterized protein n=1 Tax=[Clostridium] celerecrescens 18A TaxID=1286362 RepID=A0A2M8ZAU2_9FIRM|nr:hypothetical protein [Lacrimispora celerecrescens]PJJ30543.1 hypothetical protein H171_4149 [[Clostridium] celerecrescens 18A]
MVKKVIYFTFGIPITLIALLGMSGSQGDKNYAPPLTIFLVLLALGVLLIYLGIKTKTGKKKKQELESSIKNSQQSGKKQYQMNHIKAEHVSGLPLAVNADCLIGFEQDRFSFVGGGNEFSLSFDKITSFDVKTDVEIQNQTVSSVGGAVGGALLFGPLGAIVGGRAKTKKTRTLSYYIIFTYTKEDRVEYISFEIASAVLNKARDFKKIFDSKYRKESSVKIEL